MPVNPLCQSQSTSAVTSQGNPLSVVVFEERNFGVVVDHQLKFSTHIKSI